ncbi:MAG: CPBP family intramembrane metalloprotease [Solobacterium sp.]|nr:CPBP family intramembrane metalloprotease [Solobacterium sp.]
MNHKYSKKAVIVFFILVFIASICVETGIIMNGSSWLYLLLMWIPAISAIIAAFVAMIDKKENFSFKRFFDYLSIRGCKLKYILLAILFPLVYLLIPYMIYWILFPNNFAYHGVSLLLILQDILPSMILGIFFNLISAIGEEIGWRGFMFPSFLERMPLKRVLLTTSLIWVLWHMPLLIVGGYMDGAPLWYRVPAFLFCILPVGIIVGLLTYQTKSIWPATFLHAAHNNFDQSIFGVITRGDNRMYYVSETGILTIICALIIAILLYRLMGKKKESNPA